MPRLARMGDAPNTRLSVKAESEYERIGKCLPARSIEAVTTIDPAKNSRRYQHCRRVASEVLRGVKLADAAGRSIDTVMT